MEDIAKIEWSSHNYGDKLCWIGNFNGNFLVKVWTWVEWIIDVQMVVK